ncbi:efflux RND transporter permease subunit [Chitinophaga sp. CC14]|uniref:efflux RND transporter permease subunit n=1 Tax=Chitinophaga sp. CC14 TaxID=3029199 RepID=UPI003B75E9CE
MFLIKIIKGAIANRPVPILLTVILVALGVYSLLTMPRAEDPRITVLQAQVIAFYPGADEKQVEQQVTDLIEKYIFSFEEVRKGKTVSYSKAGQAIITVELEGWVKDTKLFWNTLQNGINTTLRPRLPAGVVGPVVNSGYADVVAHLITLSSPSRSYGELASYLDKFEDGIKPLPAIAQIKRYGEQREQIHITILDNKLRLYGFDFNRIVQVLQAQNSTAYSGEITLSSDNVPLFSDNRYKDISEISNQIIYNTPQGNAIRLKDIARIERGYEQPVSYIRFGNDRAVMLAITMQPGNNVVQFGHTLEQRIAEIRKSLPPDVEVNTIVNQSKFVASTINHFLVEFGIAIAAVILVVMIMLPFRIAVIPAAVAPISIFIAIGILNLLGIELHQVSLAGLIICLGMVVDDAIVVVDSYLEKLDAGESRWNAAWSSAYGLFLPISVATAAIILTFLPLKFFLTGLAREFMQPLPICIAVSLIVSQAVAIFITPLMCYTFVRKGLKKEGNGAPVKRSLLDRTQQIFDALVEKCFRNPRATLLAGGASVLLAIILAMVGQVPPTKPAEKIKIPAALIQQELFPIFDRTQLNLEVTLPPNASLAATDSVVRRIEQILRKDKRITNTASFIGTSSPRIHVTYAPQAPRENHAQVFINTISDAATKEIAAEYFQLFADFIPGGYVHVRQLNFTQTVAPVEVRITGPDIEVQTQIGRQVATIMRRAPGTSWIRTDYGEDYYGATLEPKTEKAAQAGITNANIINTLGAGLRGIPASTLWEGNKPVDLLLRLDESNRNGFKSLQDIYVTGPYGKVPLREITTLKQSWHTENIVHRNGLRCLTVMAEAQQEIKASQIINAIRPYINQIKLPPGYTITFGGEAESVDENMPPMTIALLASILAIFLLLLFYYKSITKALIVLATFPLSLFGAMLGLWVTGNPIGFTSYMGIDSLTGVVIRNGLIKVSYADDLVKGGLSIHDAAMASAKRRMRPIFLTSIVTAIAVIPMIMTRSPLWAPLASVVAFGSMVSMFQTLFVIPVLYWRFVKPANNQDHELPNTTKHITMPHLSTPIILMILAPFFMLASSPVKGQVAVPGDQGKQVLTLEQCFKIARNQNKTLKIADEEIAITQPMIKQATKAALPTVTGDASAFYLAKPLSQVLPGYGGYTMVSIQQPVYTGGKINLSKKEARELNAMASDKWQLQIHGMRYEIVKAYWNIVAATSKVKLAYQLQTQVKALYNDLNNSYEAGVSYKNDLLRAGVQLNECELAINQATNDLQLSKMILAQLIGLGTDTDLTPADTISIHAPTPTVEKVIEKFVYPGELTVFQHMLEIERIKEHQLKAELLPQINLSLNGLYFAGKNNGGGILPDNNFATGYGMISLRIPILDWGMKRQQISSQQHRIAMQQLQLDEAKEQLTIHERQVNMQLDEAVQRVELARASLLQASENLKLSDDRFKAGTTTGKDVLEAQVLWQQAQTGLINAIINLHNIKALRDKLSTDTIYF